MNAFTQIIGFTVPFGLAMVLTFVLLPVWISICKKWHLFDEPDNRKHHVQLIPSMGGIAMFAGLCISFMVFAEITDHVKIRYIVAGSLILFFTGFFDDLMNIPASKKLMFQIIAATVVYFAGFRIFTILGLANIGDIPIIIGYPLTIFIIATFTNAYNFIDGTDGLAASIGIVISASLGVMFLIVAKPDFATFAFCLTGSLMGFLFFNFYPAKIFMGDTGSLFVGFTLIVMAIELYSTIVSAPELNLNPAIVPAILFVPFFDIVRVTVIRLINGKSLFTPDRTHLHHKVMSFGFGHAGTTLLISTFTSSIIALQLLLNQYSMLTFLVVAILYALLVTNYKFLSLLAAIRDKISHALSSVKA